MFLIIFIILCSIALPVVGSLTFWPVQHWYDFYIPIVLLIAGFIGGIIIEFIVVFIISLCVNSKKDRMKPSRWAYWWLHQGIKCINYFSSVDCTVVGANKLPKNKQFVLVCNHRSNYDPMLIIEKFSLKHIAFISKESNMKMPMIGPLLRASCYQGINRTDKEQSLEIIKKCTKFVADGTLSVGVFPEGTRQRKEIIGPFHEGVFNIALKAQCPVVIVTVKNTDQIKKNAPFRRTHVFHDIVTVLPYEELEGKTAKAVSDLVRDIMENNLRRYEQHD